jgi:anthranilate phosphoribosyltransferase
MSTPPAHHEILGRLAAGQSLSQDATADAVDQIMQGRWNESEIGLFLTALAQKGETAAEVAGAATAMRRHMRRLKSARTGIVDTCGTGGTGSTIFNVSTTAAIVAAASGVPVAKHGNRRVTSRSGSADVLAELGVNVEAPLEVVEACLEELGLCFCFAPLMHAAMKHVGPVRKQLGIRTIFNLLGPLTNPAGAQFQLLGVGKAEIRPLLADAMALLGTERAAIAGGDDGLGEVTIAGPTHVIEVRGGEGAAPRHFAWTPADFGLQRSPTDSLSVDSPAASAALIRRVLGGEQGPPRDIVVANAAAAIWVAGRADATRAAADQARAAIDSGAARDLLERLIAMSNQT